MSMIVRDFGEGSQLGNPLLMLLPMLGKMVGGGGQGQGAGGASGGGGLMSLLNTFISSAAQAPGAQPPPVATPPVLPSAPTPMQTNQIVTGEAPPSPCRGNFLYSPRFNFCWNPGDYATEDDAARAMGLMAPRASDAESMLPTPPSAAQQQFRPFQQPRAAAAAGGRRGRKAARKGRRGRRGLRDAYALGAAAGGTSTLAIVLTTLGGALVVGAAVYGYKRARAA